MNWNWFYSAVSQSSAAIISIFSAFIINKIINNQIQFKKNKNKIEELIIKSKHLKDKTTNRSFEWYNKRIRNKKLEKIEKEIDEGNNIESKEYYYNKYNFSIYDEKEKILDSILSLLNKKKKEKSTPSKRLSNIPSIIKNPEISMKLTQQKNN